MWRSVTAPAHPDRAGRGRVDVTLLNTVTGDERVERFALVVDVDNMRRRLESSFGPEVLDAAERRVRRRPWWRGGRPRPSALCVHLLAKRSFELAPRFASGRVETGIGPDHLLFGVLQDALDPLGTQLSRRSRRELECVGFRSGRPKPVRLQLQARGLDLSGLAAQIGG
jgi:hypothetical protein